MKELRLFMASTNDLKMFRERAQDVIDELNETLGKALGTYLRLFRYEQNAFSEMGRPQEAIFEQADFDNIDIFIGLVWCRFGSPTGGLNEQKKEYESGTQEEFVRAYQNNKESKKPSIMIFRDMTPVNPEKIDIEQYQKLMDFLKKFKPNGEYQGIIVTTEGIDDFEKKFRKALLSKVLLQKIQVDSGDRETLIKSGYKKIYTATMNQQRNIAKNEAILGSKFVYLLAKTGNSFIGAEDNRYLEIIGRNIKKFGSMADIKILLLNPWTLSAVYTAFTESDSYRDFIGFMNNIGSSQQIVNTFEDTKWYKQKLENVIRNFHLIKEKYPQINLRFIDFEITASILITETSMFYESYSNFVKNDRLLKTISSFEVEVSDSSQLYKEALVHFMTLWNFSQSYEDVIENSVLYKNQLAVSIDSLHYKKTNYYIGVHALVKNDNRFLILHRATTNTYMPGKWDIPGGEMEQGETPKETAIRETKEETGLLIQPINIIYAYSNKSELPFRQTLQLIYESECFGGDIELNKNEHDDYKWVTKEELIQEDIMDFLRSFVQDNAVNH